MNLIADIGNTLVKIAVVDNGAVVSLFRSEIFSELFVADIKNTYPDADAFILSSVRDISDTDISFCSRIFKEFVFFDSTVEVPIVNRYATPSTLGMDRLAAAVGAVELFPARNILIIDFGSAITIDFVNAKGEFMGGNISPGVALRFKSLNEFTSRLPLCTLPSQNSLIGNSTQSAIEAGVVNGIVYEIERYIELLSLNYEDITIIFTGGDGKYFAERLKNTIFVNYELTILGLNRILEYNKCK